jgi:hypothetical protein
LIRSHEKKTLSPDEAEQSMQSTATMNRAIEAIKVQGWWAIYAPLMINGKIVGSGGRAADRGSRLSRTRRVERQLRSENTKQHVKSFTSGWEVSG